MVRRPLFLAFVLGCGVSMLGSGRFTVRLIADGALSFAFVPLAELLGFAVAYRGLRGRSFAQAVDDFFATNQPWLWWCVALITAAAIVPASRHGSLLAPILMTAPIPILLSGLLEWQLARSTGLNRGRATASLFVQRAVAWSAATAYFFGVAITTRDFFYLFVEMGQEVSNWVGNML